jgi:hypothetical protein
MSLQSGELKEGGKETPKERMKMVNIGLINNERMKEGAKGLLTGDGCRVGGRGEREGRDPQLDYKYLYRH